MLMLHCWTAHWRMRARLRMLLTLLLLLAALVLTQIVWALLLPLLLKAGSLASGWPWLSMELMYVFYVWRIEAVWSGATIWFNCLSLLSTVLIEPWVSQPLTALNQNDAISGLGANILPPIYSFNDAMISERVNDHNMT